MNYINERVLKEADYILKTGYTIREVATYFNVSKSTVHKDLHERLKKIDKIKYLEVDKNLKYHGSIADLSPSDLEYISGEDTSDIQSLIDRLRCQLKSFNIYKFYKSKSCIDFNKFIFKY